MSIVNKVWPCTIIPSRYRGTYSGGQWLALNCKQHEIPSDIHGSDPTCASYFSHLEEVEVFGYRDNNTKVGFQDKILCIGVGGSLNEAYKSLESLADKNE